MFSGMFPDMPGAARTDRAAVEAPGTAPAGSRLHAVGDEGVPLREIAEVIGRRLGLPVTGLPPEEARAHFGRPAHFVLGGHPASGALTRERLGRRPRQPGLLADLDRDHCFQDYCFPDHCFAE
jgi:hypothetical protein